MFYASVSSSGAHCPGISRAFADILVTGWASKNFSLPGGRAFAYPWDGPGAFDTPVRFLHLRNKWILKVIQDDHFRKNLFRFWSLLNKDHAFSVLQ